MFIISINELISIHIHGHTMRMVKIFAIWVGYLLDLRQINVCHSTQILIAWVTADASFINAMKLIAPDQLKIIQNCSI